jgi:hypothetical protein
VGYILVGNRVPGGEKDTLWRWRIYHSGWRIVQMEDTLVGWRIPWGGGGYPGGKEDTLVGRKIPQCEGGYSGGEEDILEGMEDTLVGRRIP